MAQNRIRRAGRPQKRNRSANDVKDAAASSRRHERAVAEVEQEQSSDLTDSESEDKVESRPFHDLLGLFNVDPERQHRKPKRRKIAADVQPATSSERYLEDGSEASSQETDNVAEDDIAPQVSDDSDGQEDIEDAEEDPFIARIDAPDQVQVNERIQSLLQAGWTSHEEGISGLGNCTKYAPKKTTLYNQLAERHHASSAGVKAKLLKVAQDLDKDLSKSSKSLSPYISGYSDVLFGARTPYNADDLRRMTCLHALNHIFKTRDRILKHNNKSTNLEDDQSKTFRDQGFTRPKVLFMLPTRGACVKVVESLIQMSQAEQQENKKRFEDGFEAENDELLSDRPDDFRELFHGNTDDMFRIGIKFTRKTMKLFAPFYSSDIILASPLGLRNAIDGGKDRKPDYDFLSSVEIVIIDHADALLMQNWDHVIYIMQHLNLSPKEAHGCDFSRVRMWYLDDQAKYLRQTICLSSFITPEINALFNKYMLNVFGKLKYQAQSDGATLTTGLPIKQTFSRYQSTNIKSDPDTRFSFFTSTVIPWMLRQPRPAEGGLGILIFVPSYFDFIRIKNYFTTSPTVTSLSFATVTENHTSAEPETRRARSHFLTGKSSVLIYTGRAHHFYRYLIKGVKHVVMYQLPDNPIFYHEIVAGFLNASVVSGRIAAEEGSARVLFSKWDALRLERIVGTDRVRSMMGAGDTFDFI